MNGIILAVIAQVIIGISLIVDKTFLKEKVAGNVFAYVFWIGISNFFAIFVAPFDFVNPGFWPGFLAFLAGVFFFLALIFYYKALEGGEASSTLAVLGGFTPLATILASTIFLQEKLNIIELFCFLILTLGGFLMFLADFRNFKKVYIWILLSAICFGLTNALQKVGYDESSFLTGYGIMKFGTFAATLSLLIVPTWRKQVFERTVSTENKNKIYYLANRSAAGIASVALSYGIKLSHPALIEATSGVKYAIVFLIAFVLAKKWPQILKENFSTKVLILKVTATILIMLSVLGLSLQTTLQTEAKQSTTSMEWGVSFSKKMSQNLGNDWQANYLAIVDDLKPDGIRLMAYWDLIEPSDDQWTFADLDWQVQEAAERYVPVIIAIGQKVPRWPECHLPDWVGDNIKQAELLEYEKKVVERYRNYDNLLYWQVENEPYIPFGECKRPAKKQVLAEINLVRKIDSSHKILLTDGGEWGKWYSQMKNGNIFGTTMYRKVYKKHVGSVHPPLTPEYYEVKKSLAEFLAGKKNHPIIISELGLEPWANKQIYELSIENQKKLFSNKDFKDFIDFARRTNFDTAYMWGVEWWYYLKQNGDASYWNQAKVLINSN